MDSDEYRLALAYEISLDRCGGGDVAVLWDKRGTLTAIQQAPKVDPHGTSIDLPIVRLLRNRGTRKNGFSISTTAAPTAACLGMARMCGIGRILYLSGENIAAYTCARTSALSTILHPTGGSIPDVTSTSNSPVVAPKPTWASIAKSPAPGGHPATVATKVEWRKDPSKHKNDLKAWRESVAKLTSIEGTSAQSAKTMAISNSGPLPSTFPSSGLEYLALKSIVTDQKVLDNVIMMMAFEMVSRVSGFATSVDGTVSTVATARHTNYEGQNIGSLMSDVEGNIVGWGFNTNTQNSTRHGEVNLITAFLTDNPEENSLPDGGTIYTTLEPCEMCSGMIARTAKSGTHFRVIYGQKDNNVAATALQTKANPSVSMEQSEAALVTAEMIRKGSATGATNKLVAAMQANQADKKIPQATRFLKEQSTYESFFGAARPNWWLYLWDYLTARLTIAGVDNSKQASELLKDPAVVKVNNQLDVIYTLVDGFMNRVAGTGRA